MNNDSVRRAEEDVYASCVHALREAEHRPLDRIEVAALRWACGIAENSTQPKEQQCLL